MLLRARFSRVNLDHLEAWIFVTYSFRSALCQRFSAALGVSGDWVPCPPAKPMRWPSVIPTRKINPNKLRCIKQKHFSVCSVSPPKHAPQQKLQFTGPPVSFSFSMLGVPRLEYIKSNNFRQVSSQVLNLQNIYEVRLWG